MSLSWWHGLVNRGTLKLKSSPARRHGRRRKEARRILFEPLEPRVLLDGNPGTDPGNGLINLNAGLSSPASPEAYITNPDRPGGGGVATTTTVTSSNASAVYGTAVTFTATVSAQSGGTAPTAGSVDFYDTTTSTDLGDGAFGSSTGTTSTWTLTTGVKTFNVTAGDTVTATYTAGSGFRGSSGTMTQTVNPFPITVTAVASTKTYDGSTSSSATPTISYGGPADSLVSGDTASFTEAYNTSNLGTGLTLAPAGSVNDGNGGHNYAVTLVDSTAGAIFPVGTTTTTTASTSQGSVVYGTVVTFTATVSAQSGSTAPGQGSVDFYDTTTSHDLGSGTFGISTGTTSTWTFTTGAKTFNVTTGDTITATYSPGLGFNGSSGTITQAVTPRAITITATSNTKTYDGMTAAAATPTITGGSLVAGDTVTGLAEAYAYGDPDAGTNQTLCVTSYTINDGNGGANYAVSLATAPGVINKANATIEAWPYSGTYDTGAYMATGSATGIGGVNLDSDLYLGGTRHTNAANYSADCWTFTDPSGNYNSASGYLADTISQAGLTITAVANTKTYDGTTSAAATPTVSGLMGSDTVTGLVESYADPNPGTAKTLNVTAYTIHDNNMGWNYAVSLVSATGAINAAVDPTTTTTVSTSQASVIYGTPVTFTATVTAKGGSGPPSQGSVDFKDTTTGTDLGDGPFGSSTSSASTWTLTTVANTFNVTAGDTITAAYSPGSGFSGSSGTTTQVVTPRPITVSAAYASKTYDGTTSSTVTPTITGGSLVSGDTAAFTESFANRNAGTGKTLTAAGSVDDGNGGHNYAVTFVTETTGLITPRPITVTAGSATNTYDGSVCAAATPTITGGSLATGDTAAFTETYNTRNVGTGLTLTPGGSVNDGNGGNNYAVTFDTATSGVIFPASLFLDAMSNSKIYDGTTSAAATPTAYGLLGGDSVTASETYAGKTAGSDITLSVAPGYVIHDGNGGNNYNVSLETNPFGSITPRAVTVTAAGATKVYDGTTSTAAVPTITGGLGADDTAAFTETFASKSVGTGITLTPSGSVNDGMGGNNYAVTWVANNSGSISARAITVTAAASTKVYDGSTSSTATPTITAGSLAAGDTATFTEAYETPAVGTCLTLTPAGSVNDGDGGQNYAVTLVASTNGVIFDPGVSQPSPSAETDGSLVLPFAPLGINYISSADPRPIVSVDAYLQPEDGQSSPLDSVQTSLTFDGIQGGTADYSAAGVDGTDAYRFALQADVGSLPTGRYGWQMTITENYQDNSSQTNTYDGQSDVLNLNQSPLGQDWQFASLDWLVPAAGGGVVQADGSVGLVQGDGTMAFFAANGQGGWSSQPGPLAFTSLSRQIGGPQNGDFILEGTDGVKEVFDPSSGRLLSVTDRDGNTTSYAYNGSGQLTSVTNDLDETTVYAYSGGYLSTVTDYARRVTTLGYNSGQLVTIIQPDPQDSGAPVTRFGYDATSGLLTWMVDPDGNTTSYEYDSTGSLVEVVNPGPGNTTELYTSVQSAALAVGNPAPLVPASGVQATYTDELNNTTTTTFDRFGLPTSVTDALGNVTTYVRDGNGLVTEMIQPDPLPGQDSGPPVTLYQYDAAGDLTGETLPDGSQLTWNYTTVTTAAGGKYEAVTESIDELEHQTWYTISSTTGDVLAVEQVLGSSENPEVDPITQYTYTPAPASQSDLPGGLITSETDPLGNTTTYTYQYNTSTYELTVTETQPDPVNGQNTSTDHGPVTIDVYDGDGNLLSDTQPDPANGHNTSTDHGPVTSYTYDNLGREATMTEPAPQTGGTAPMLTYVYDSDGNVVKEGDGFSNSVQFGYDSCDELTSQTDADGHTTRYAYDADGDLLSVTQPDPANGQNTTSDHGPVTTYAYDALGRQTKVYLPNPLTGQAQLTTATTYAYDHLGNLISQTDALGNVTKYAYNDRSELVSQTDPDGDVTTYTYDPAGNMLTMTDPDGNETAWTYDALNRVTQETECVDTSSQASSYYQYDSAGDLVQATDYDGRVIQYVYDHLGRETNENWMSGQTVVESMTFSYDAMGRLLSASDPSSGYTYTYDNDGNTLSTTASYAGLSSNVTLQQVYDGNGYMTDLYAYVGGTADFHNSYTYDNDGNVLSITQQANAGNAGGYQGYTGFNSAISPKYVSLSYDYDGNMTGVSRYAGLSASGGLVATSTYGYDHDGNLLSLAETDASGSTLPTYTWQYDADNRVVQSGSSYTGDGTVTYGYDAASQLTSASYSSPPSGLTSPQTFSYDANGNRNSTGYVTGPNNELLSDGTYSYQVDANGNEIARWVDNNGVRESSPQPGDTQITVYGWDYRNRLTTATSYADYTDYHLSQNATQTIQYTYDVFNRRISETVTTGGVSTTEYFVYDGQQVLLQLSATGAVTERYLWGPAADKVLAEESASGVSWLLTDGQGSVRDVVTYTAGATAIADHIDYSAFGVEYETTPSADPGIGFAGQFWDAAAGSYYCEARSYNPSTGRYESVDPTGFSAGDPNLYAYVFNDPTNLVDPTGEAVARGPTVPMLAAPGTTWVWPWDYSNASWNPYDTLQLWTGVNKQVFPHGGGVLGSACAEAGMVTGAALEFFAGVGVFSNGAGVFGGGGGVKPLDPSVSWPKPAMVGGAYAGGGGGVFLTNATSVMGIGGEFQTFNLNVGCGPAKFSASYAQSSDGIWMLSVLPPVAGDGLGFDVSTYQTDTRTIGW